MMSLAEYCSIWPTAGGQQYYTQAVATGPTRPFLSYFVGWAVIVGEISTGSSCALNSADIIASFVEVTHPDFAWHVSTPSAVLERLITDGLMMGSRGIHGSFIAPFSSALSPSI
jgi:amino acid transporter